MKKVLTFVLCMCIMPLFSEGMSVDKAIRDAKSSLYVYTSDPSVIRKLFWANAKVKLAITRFAAETSHGDELARLVRRRDTEVWVIVNFTAWETAVIVDEKYVFDARRREVFTDKSMVRHYIWKWESHKSHSVPCR